MAIYLTRRSVNARRHSATAAAAVETFFWSRSSGRPPPLKVSTLSPSFATQKYERHSIVVRFSSRHHLLSRSQMSQRQRRRRSRRSGQATAEGEEEVPVYVITTAINRSMTPHIIIGDMIKWGWGTALQLHSQPRPPPVVSNK